jgi:AAA domain-containing protein/primase-like protein
VTVGERTALDFFAALFPFDEDHVELRALPSTARTFVALGSDLDAVDDFVREHRDENVYFGVASRRHATDGTLQNCRLLVVLFSDFDFKTTPESVVRAQLVKFPLPPSLIVRSGGGLHVYWLLREPLELPDDFARTKDLLRRLALHLGGDLGSAEPAHVLRVPGTRNFKYTPPRAVTVEALDPERRYNPSEFDDLLPAEPVAERGAPFTMPDEPLAEGEGRNNALYRLIRSLKAKHISVAAITAAVDAENARFRPPLPGDELRTLLHHALTQADRPDFAVDDHQSAGAAADPAGAADSRSRTQETEPDSTSPALTIVGMGAFIARTFPEPEPLIEGILSDDGGGWIGGEEKTNKTWWMEAEATSLALAVPLAGRFAVPRRRRALILEEEDSPRRTHRRVRAVLRGHGVDPDDPAVQADLDAWLRVSVWSGFSLDNSLLVAQLDAAIRDFRPAVVHIDCLRKVTLKNLNHADEAGALLAILDDLRRRYDVVFRLVHHFRKQQGFRTGRGSQEIGGSFVLGAWGENSLFFEPVGRKQGAVRVEVQSKDGAPVPGFTLTIESEGSSHVPDLVRLVAKHDVDPNDVDEIVYQAVATLPKQDAVLGAPGVPFKTIKDAVKKGDKTVRRSLDRLVASERCLVTGTMTKQAKLYAVNAQ